MAVLLLFPAVNFHRPQTQNRISIIDHRHHRRLCFRLNSLKHRQPFILSEKRSNSNEQDGEIDNLGVKAALSVLKFYKREISPLLPKSCRYVPTCSEYSMEAYKKYGFAKGTILTAWRVCRCNPLGGSGFDPPRWFDERSLPEDEQF